jgi:1,4-dihydroxy-2-naphthoate octaprenyltransferase
MAIRSPGYCGVLAMNVAAAVAPTGIRIWLLAARPATLPAAVVPVLVGTASALHGLHQFNAPVLIPTLLAALLIQIGTNFANDVFDFRRGADTAERLGPLRVTQGGLVSPGHVLTAT